ncbi:MAG: Amidohydrolase [Alphaproteobacteria bacterium ADurb.Bin438]|nr:MAG: Amidohydrolase [Alphaproteobacteria bacterium ADurb.Bin438]
MIIDMHTHIPSLKTGLKIEGISSKLSYLGLKLLFQNKSNQELIEFFIKSIKESIVEKSVVLALDGAYEESGKLIKESIYPNATNEEVICVINKNKDILLFGASIHPYRKDAIKKLEEYIKIGAKLIKWIPSSQNIDLTNHKCIDFYQALSHYKIPLLCHSGIEHAFFEYDSSYSNPNNFEIALKNGVTLIIAHLGTNFLPFETSYFDDFKRLALKYENCYGDTSAILIPSRNKYLNEISKDKELQSKLVFGTDFPVPFFPSSYIFKLGIKKYLEIKQEKNYFNQYIKTLQENGIANETFHRFAKIIKL